MEEFRYPKVTLEAARVNAHMTQEEAATRLNVARATIRSWESGKTVPSWDKVLEMEELYHFPKDFILFPKLQS